MPPEQTLSGPRERTGRPPADPNKKNFWETDLHKLLVDRLDHLDGMVVDGRIVPARLAKLTNKNRYTIYRWLGDNRLSSGAAKAILKLAGERLTPTELMKFVLA